MSLVPLVRRLPSRLITVITVLVLLSAAAAHAAPPPMDLSWERLSGRLRGVAETYKKWGITFEVKQAAFAASPDFCPSSFKVSGGMESPDTVKMDIEAELGRKEALAVGISGTYKLEPDGHTILGKGMMTVKGTGLSIEFGYNNTDGFTLETGLEETFYSIGVKIGGDGKSPLSLGLKLGPATVKIDPVKWLNRCLLMAGPIARTAHEKVGGVLIRTDLEFMAAALSHAPPPNLLRLRDVTVVSLKRLLRASKGVNGGSAAGSILLTSVIGVLSDAESADVILIGRVEPGMPPIHIAMISALLRSIWKEGREPFVSLDPAMGEGGLSLKPRIGGLATGLEESALVHVMLSADYRMKRILYGDIAAPGITSLPAALSRYTGTGGIGSARYWFTPRPLELGDIGTIQTSGGSLTTFEVQPMVLTEKTTNGFGPGSALEQSAESGDPMDAVMRRAAAEITHEYPALERARPELRMKELRQVFELATAAAILRRQRPTLACAALLDGVAAIKVPSEPADEEFVPFHKSFQSAGRGGMIELWGGVSTGSAAVKGARMRVEKSLNGVLRRIQAVAWRGSSASISGVFDPIITDAETLDRTEVAASRLSVAEQYLKQRSLPQAMDELNRAIQLNGADPHAYHLRSVAHYLQQDLGAMIADADRAVRLAPKDAMGYYLRAYGEMDNGSVPAALDDLAQVIRLAPAWSDPYVVRGNIRIDGDPRGAIEDFNTALKTAPYKSAVYSLRGRARLKLDDKSGALADFTAAIQADRRNVGPYEGRAALLADQKDYRAVLEDRKRIAELRPSAERYSDLALAKMNVNDFAGAADDATRSIEMNPRVDRGYHLRGRAYMEAGEFAKAIADFENAMPFAPAYMKPLIQDEITQCRKRAGENP